MVGQDRRLTTDIVTCQTSERRPALEPHNFNRIEFSPDPSTRQLPDCARQSGRIVTADWLTFRRASTRVATMLRNVWYLLKWPMAGVLGVVLDTYRVSSGTIVTRKNDSEGCAKTIDKRDGRYEAQRLARRWQPSGSSKDLAWCDWGNPVQVDTRLANIRCWLKGCHHGSNETKVHAGVQDPSGAPRHRLRENRSRGSSRALACRSFTVQVGS